MWPAGPCPAEAFEQGFGGQCLECRDVVLAPSARVALYWLLRAMELGPGDEVVIQAFNFPAVPAAIRAAGATPRFLDLRAGTFEGDWERLKDLIGPHTRAVIVTHLYGNPGDLETLTALCGEREVQLVEDCAQGVGARSGRRPVGTFGRGAIFSLGPTKNLTLLGGGAVAASDPCVVRRVRDLAQQHGRIGLVASLRLAAKAMVLGIATHPIPFSLFLLPVLRRLERRGVDLVHRIMEEKPGELRGIEHARRPSRLMAAVGKAQLGRLQSLNRARIRNGWYLRSRLANVDGLAVPPMRDGSVFMSFPVLHPHREALALELRTRGVDTDFGFMTDCASLDLFAASSAECPHASRVAREILHLPVHPFLNKAHLDRIAEAVREASRAV
jgi:dTDP-4-amino-4,6-dideoxygalactose transaminase